MPTGFSVISPFDRVYRLVSVVYYCMDCKEVADGAEGLYRM
jgi:hypothetical protein